MALHTVVFKQPNRIPVPDYDPTGLYEWVKARQDADQSDRWILSRAAKKFPWLKACLPEGATPVVNAIRAEEPEFGTIPGLNNPLRLPFFREYGWHIDQRQYGTRLRLLQTGQPALFGSGTFVYEAPEALDNLTFIHKAYDYGHNWVEQVTGMAPKREFGTKDNKHSIDSFIKDIVGLEIIPGEPGVMVDGLTDETLHTPTIITSDVQTARRVIYRTQYNPLMS
jgi:hypothetical protein